MEYRRVFFKPLLVVAVLSLLTGCGGGSGGEDLDQEKSSTSLLDDRDLANAFVYKNDSPHALTLKKCIDISVSDESCPLSVLPLIGQETDTPTNEDIINRLVVSHDWMAERFIETLPYMPQYVKNLFKPVTAIVIDESIRPSFYSRASGAIYIDPSRLWLTNEEKKTISRDADYRQGFGSELSLLFLSRYVIDNKYAYNSYSLNDDTERGFAHMFYPLMSTLFHELAHANDLIPPDMINTINPEERIIDSIFALKNYTISYRLYNYAPLTSGELSALADVFYSGKEPTLEQQLMSPDYAGALFHNDGATSLYNYNNRFEDMAVLLETFLMKYLWDADRDIAFTNAPTEEAASLCANYTVAWGERNRLANPLVRHRARFVANTVFNAQVSDEIFQSYVGNNYMMETGVSWCDNLALEPIVQTYRGLTAPEPVIMPMQDLQPFPH